MKKLVAQAAALMAAAVLTVGCVSAQAADTVPVTGLARTDKIYVQGVPAVFPGEDGATFYPPIVYQGSTYMQLRTVGRWMGKNVAWDGGTQTVTLSGTAAQEFPSEDDGAYHAVGATIAGSLNPSATVSPEITVLLDGAKQTFHNEQGQELYPLVYESSVYLPLRSVGELTGFEVTWYGKQTATENNGIFLRTPITDEQKAAMTAYADSVLTKGTQLEQKLEELKTVAFTEVTVSTDAQGMRQYDLTVTNTEAALKLLPDVKALCQEISALPAPEGALLKNYAAQIKARTNTASGNVDKLTEQLNAGSHPIYFSSYSSGNGDEGLSQLMTAGNFTRQDCQRMRSIIDQNTNPVI